MSTEEPRTLARPNEHEALRAVVEGTAAHTGDRFFAELVKNLAQVLDTHGAWVTEYLEEEERLRAFAFWQGDDWVGDYEYAYAGTPCESVVKEKRLVHFPEKLLQLFPMDPDIAPFGGVSYMGVPFLDLDGDVVGHLAVMDTKVMPFDPRAEALFQIFANRASAELRRMRVEAALREREEELGRLVDSAMDAIIELDPDLRITLVNAAGEKMLGSNSEAMIDAEFSRFLTPASLLNLRELIDRLESHPEGGRHLWIPGGLTARQRDGREFSAEATLSRFEIRRGPRYTLIVRNVEDRLQAEQKIQSLTGDAQYLREELEELHSVDGIVGRSEPLLNVLEKIHQVGNTDTSVLIYGETGTGKELIARAVHAASSRCDRPLVKVNCAAIAPTLIESEFFGHEKGSFTGASRDRVGRFELANGGTAAFSSPRPIRPALASAAASVTRTNSSARLRSIPPPPCCFYVNPRGRPKPSCLKRPPTGNAS